MLPALSLEDLAAAARHFEEQLERMGTMLPRVEGEVRPSFMPPSPFMLGEIKDERKQEASRYVESFKRIFKRARDARKKAEERWRRATSAYLNQYDFGYKSPNQARAYVPRITKNVDVLAYYLRHALVESRQFFRVYALSAKLEELAAAHAVEELISYLLDINDITNKFLQLVKQGLLYGIVAMKVYVRPRMITQLTVDDEGKVKAVEREMYQLVLEGVSPFEIWLDPSGRDKFIIQLTRVDKSDLYDLARLGVLNKDAVDELIERGRVTRETLEGSKTTAEHPRERPVYILAEYWGDFWDEDGNLLHRNCWMIFGGIPGPDGAIPEDYVLMRGPLPNPYWHQKPPIIISPFTPQPTKAIYPMSLVDFFTDMQREYTRIFNAMIDGAIFDAMNVFEVNEAMVENPKDLEDIWPGKIIRKRMGEGQVITTVQLGKMPTNAAFVVQLMERFMQEGFGVTETVMGYLASRGRPTATEVVTARSHAFSQIEELARIVENSFLEPLLERVFQLAMQVLPDIADDEMLAALGDASDTLRRLITLPPESREAIARGGYRFRVHGLSMTMTKAQELAKINDFLQIVSANPIMAQKINWDALLAKVLEAYGWAPDEMLVQHPLGEHALPEHAAEAMQATQAQAAMMQAALAQALTGGEGAMPAEPELSPEEGARMEPGSMPDIEGILTGGA